MRTCIRDASWLRLVFAAGLLALAGATSALCDELVVPQEQQLADLARQCSETALRRYALSSQDPAEKVAQAAFNKCSEQWGRLADVSGRRMDADPITQETQKNCIKYQGDKCPPKLPGRFYVLRAEEAQFTYSATTEVFDIRAEAAGK
jgi:hypothetical protein